ncbi:ERF family protein [Selenomonas sp. TAMA-11512]|uniref:ERF family protein n=1 Tax=Selenomonas sp. TAMA-11512 TaxID=3095337 RepID=UPI00308A18F8|nr:ERF family protein [Selenomonas sp. TAMA-11512]
MAGKAIYAALMAVQSELKAPKGQKNTFGNYNYRSAEDILEAVKPLLKDNGLYLRISDSVELIGDRYYIKATVTVVDIATGDTESATAYAREQVEKKGVDVAQVTGATSSYARKYALNALFGIDDAKDADTDEYTRQGQSSRREEHSPPKDSTEDVRTALRALTEEMHRLNATKEEVTKICRKMFDKDSSRELTVEELKKLTASLAAIHVGAA